MEAIPGFAAILRDAAKTPLLRMRASPPRRLFRLDAGELCHFAPLLGFGEHVALHVVGRAAGGLGAELAQAAGASSP